MYFNNAVSYAVLLTPTARAGTEKGGSKPRGGYMRSCVFVHAAFREAWKRRRTADNRGRPWDASPMGLHKVGTA